MGKWTMLIATVGGMIFAMLVARRLGNFLENIWNKIMARRKQHGSS